MWMLLSADHTLLYDAYLFPGPPSLTQAPRFSINYLPNEFLESLFPSPDSVVIVITSHRATECI